MSRASGGRTVRTVRIGSFTANAVEDGAEVSIGDVQTRVSNGCFGVSMTERSKPFRKPVNPWEIAHKSHDVSGRPTRSAARSTPPPAARQNALLRVSVNHRRGVCDATGAVGTVRFARRRHLGGDSPAGRSRVFPS